MQPRALVDKVISFFWQNRKDADPFEEPECVAEDVFVNEQKCIGRGNFAGHRIHEVESLIVWCT